MPQGSQVFARDQARALAAAGASVEIVCYGRGLGETPADLRVVRTPAILTPRATRAGPHWAKPVADAALLRALVRAHRREPFDAVLAHNAEAALLAAAARRRLRAPLLYVAHALLARELAHYGPRALRGPLDRAGAALDRAAARAADGVMALCPAAQAALAGAARGPVETIPPGLDPAAEPASEAIAETCARFALEPGDYALYSGNLDAYQGLDALAAAAAALPDLPVVAATHGAARAIAGLRVVEVGSAEEMRRLVFGAAVAVAPRRDAGGFPIKLLNYMEAARPIVAREGVVGTLVHDENAWLLPRDAPPEALAEALFALRTHADRAARLGAAARETLEREHAWPALAERTLALLRTLRPR